MAKFSKMTLQEVEKWEKETNSVVFFSPDGETSIAFQKSDDVIIIMPDVHGDDVFILHDEQIKRLNEFLNS